MDDSKTSVAKRAPVVFSADDRPHPQLHVLAWKFEPFAIAVREMRAEGTECVAAPLLAMLIHFRGKRAPDAPIRISSKARPRFEALLEAAGCPIPAGLGDDVPPELCAALVDRVAAAARSLRLYAESGALAVAALALLLAGRTCAEVAAALSDGATPLLGAAGALLGR